MTAIVNELVRELFRRDRRVALTGIVLLATAAVSLMVAPFDTRTVTGANPWLKPIKFQASFALYAFSITWLMHYVILAPWLRAALSRGLAVIMLAEIAIITSQAARGTTSHFNFDTFYDYSLFVAMGIGVILMTVFMFGLLVLFCFQKIDLPAAYLWGIRGGLALFLLGLVPGWYMILYITHTVGLPDGGPGVPVFGWSTTAGDLRIAHFLGLHALQVLPLAGYLVTRLQAIDRTTRQRAFAVAAALYAAAMLFTFVQALAGQPLLAY